MSKNYARDPSTFKTIAYGWGSCIATDRITVDGSLVGFMYRDEPNDELDSGWRFFSGDESDDYANNPANLGLFDVNTIANYDPYIAGYLDAECGTAWVRKGNTFVPEAFPRP